MTSPHSTFYIPHSTFCRARRGFSLLETLLATSLLAFLMIVVGDSLGVGHEGVAVFGDRSRALLVAEEAFEATGNIRDAGFSNLTNGTYGLATSGNQWQFAGTFDAVGIATRSVTVLDGGARRKNISATVNWEQTAQRAGQVALSGRMTDWRKNFGNWANPVSESSANLSGSDEGREIALYRTATRTFAVVVRESGSNSELFTIDVSNPASPVVSGNLELGSDANDVAIAGNYAVVASSHDSQELQVVDLTNIASPALAGTLNLSGNTNALSVSATGTTVFLGRAASSNPEISSISIASPASPVIISTLELGSGADAEKMTLAKSGQFLYVASPANSSEFVAVSVGNPSSISLTGTYNASGDTDATAVASFGPYAVLGRSDGEFSVLDLTNPASPALISTPIDIGSRIRDLSAGVGDVYIFSAGNTGGQEIQVISVVLPATPSLLGSVNLGDDARGVVWDYDLNRAFVATEGSSSELMIVKPQ